MLAAALARLSGPSSYSPPNQRARGSPVCTRGGGGVSPGDAVGSFENAMKGDSYNGGSRLFRFLMIFGASSGHGHWAVGHKAISRLTCYVFGLLVNKYKNQIQQPTNHYRVTTREEVEYLDYPKSAWQLAEALIMR